MGGHRIGRRPSTRTTCRDRSPGGRSRAAPRTRSPGAGPALGGAPRGGRARAPRGAVALRFLEAPGTVRGPGSAARAAVGAGTRASRCGHGKRRRPRPIRVFTSCRPRLSVCSAGHPTLLLSLCLCSIVPWPAGAPPSRLLFGGAPEILGAPRLPARRAALGLPGLLPAFSPLPWRQLFL